MKAVRIHNYGGSDVLVYEEAPRPDIGEDDVLIRVHAASVNPLDWQVRAGYAAAWFNHTLPLTLGWDVSGVIEAVGPGVRDFQAGDAVFARTDINRDGAYAEYIVTTTACLARKPEALDHVQAAAIPNAALAAWQSLEAADLRSGQKILIHRAAGGVGTFAVQLAKRRGAQVVATASPQNIDFLRQLGADEIVDYTKVRFEEVLSDIDVVLDTLGGEVQARCWQVLKPGGVLVSLVQPPSEETAAAYGVQQCMVGATPDVATLEEIAGLIDAGKMQSVVSTVLPLAEARQAHILSEGMHTRGKIVLQVVG